jgi:glycosyltransferase involved in cell wall biosynthesis
MLRWDAVSELLDIRVVVESDDPSIAADGRFRALRPVRSRLFRTVTFYARIPHAIRDECLRFRPGAIIAQSPYEAAAALVGRRLAGATVVPLIVEVHGDWRSASRLYGSPWRRLMAPLADALARWALRQADATRAIGPAMSRLSEDVTGRPPLAVYPTFFDAATYFASHPVPLPPTPTALWVGVLQRYKNPRALAAAWNLVAASVPDAQLVVVGSGPLERVVDALRDAYPDRVRLHRYLPPSQLKEQFDSATVLVLPSRSEGLGRVVIEAFARGRPVIGARVGGIPDLVHHEVNGLLVPSEDPAALAEAMIRVLRDRELASRLGLRARADAEQHRWTPDRYARALLDMVRRASREATGSAD